MKHPNWNEVEKRLYEASVVALKNFSAECPDEEICYFAFDSEPYYGYVLICFDTTENSISGAKLSARRSLELVDKFIRKDCDWQMAKSAMISASALPFTNNTGDFKYPRYAEINFEGWQEFADSEAYPVGDFDEGDDYLEGNMAIILRMGFNRYGEPALIPGMRGHGGARLHQQIMVWSA